MALTGRLSFDRFEVDFQRRRLTRGGRPVRLEPKPFTLLAILLSRAGETVPRAELHKALWPGDTHVAFETGLNTAVRKLRRALGESAHAPRVIQTVPGVGYRVIATVVPVAQPPGLEAPASDPPPPIPAIAPLPVSRPTGRQVVALLAIVLTSILTAPSFSAPGGGFMSWRSYAALARQALTANDFRGATVEFARAVAAGADHDALFAEYACALARQRQPALALEVIERGLARRPYSVTLRAHRGLYLHAVGRYDEELAALTDAVALDPGSAEAHFHLGLGFARRRHYGASLLALQRAVDLSDGAPRFLSWLGRIAADAGRRAQAEAVLRSLERQAITRPVPEDLINAVAFHLSAAARS